LISAGLDCCVKVWDIRKLGSSHYQNKGQRHIPGTLPPLQPIVSYHGGKSVNSAFFSPTGQYMISTTQANRLDLFYNLHHQTSSGTSSTGTGSKKALSPSYSIRHNNQTGRWLTTLNAVWHPTLDMFVVGNVEQKPRTIEIFDGIHGMCLGSMTGDALTAVASRCAFHSNTSTFTVVGGNSSGRVSIVR
jgi:WD repeat-containing protein 76